MTQQLGSIECPTCQALFHGVEIHDGLAAIEARPCADADCGKPLCQNCSTFVCDGCAQTFCAEHAVTIPDSTEKPLRVCAACAEECTVQTCPCCSSANVYTDYIEFGADPETGYHDAAAIFTCRACGVRGEAEELVERPAIAALPARREPGRETREAARKGVA